MAAIRSGDTKPEMLVRTALHAAGFRYRLHAKDLPGRPDLVFPKYRAVLFVNGCFWHRHDCHRFKWPSTRPDFWKNKLGRNAESDQRAIAALTQAGWRVGTVWECAVIGRTKLAAGEVMRQLKDWVQSDLAAITIEGRKPDYISVATY
jgi:DNA mismatch endonuclease (patch repair protein)